MRSQDLSTSCVGCTWQATLAHYMPDPGAFFQCQHVCPWTRQSSLHKSLHKLLALANTALRASLQNEAPARATP